MAKPSTKEPTLHELFGPDPLEDAVRGEIRERLEGLLREELTATLGADGYERVATRCGYRNGSRPRGVATSVGPVALRVPRGLLPQPDGTDQEWQPRSLPRYQRRSASVDAAILGTYLAGANTRRLAAALRPLLKRAPLSKDSVSRLVRRLRDAFTEWLQRDLREEALVYLYLDAIAVKVRCGGRVVSLPVLVAVGVTADGQKRLLALRLVGSESTAAWETLVADLARRGVTGLRLVVIDGNPGLQAAVETTWPGVPLQRCTVHKLRNVLGHAPQHCHEALHADYEAIVYAADEAAARAAHAAFVRKWSKRCAPAVTSLLEAGDLLFTHFRFPAAQRKSLRSTNVIERLHGEFRRRVKTQGALPTPEAVLLLFFGLLVSGQVRFRRIDGWQAMPQVLAPPLAAAA